MKSAHLAAEPHLTRWGDRLDTSASDLDSIAGSARWSSDSPRSRALVQSTYAHLAAGTPLWLQGGEFVLADGPITL